MIHPVGLGGAPSDGHRCNAIVNASCTASSARSMSPRWRTRTATARPYPSRNRRSIADASTAVISTGASNGTAIARSRRLAAKRADFDWQRNDAREFASPLEGGVEIGRLDDQESAEIG